MSSKEEKLVSVLLLSLFLLAAGFTLIIAADFFVEIFFVVTGLILAYGAILMFVRMIQLRKVR